VTKLWHLHNINIPCKYITEDSVYLQYNVTLQNSVSKIAGNAILSVEKYEDFLVGKCPHATPYYYIRQPLIVCSSREIWWTLNKIERCIFMFSLP
jgi:hypothetical protein